MGLDTILSPEHIFSGKATSYVSYPKSVTSPFKCGPLKFTEEMGPRKSFSASFYVVGGFVGSKSQAGDAGRHFRRNRPKIWDVICAETERVKQHQANVKISTINRTAHSAQGQQACLSALAFGSSAVLDVTQNMISGYLANDGFNMWSKNLHEGSPLLGSQNEVRNAKGASRQEFVKRVSPPCSAIAGNTSQFLPKTGNDILGASGESNLTSSELNVPQVEDTAPTLNCGNSGKKFVTMQPSKLAKVDSDNSVNIRTECTLGLGKAGDISDYFNSESSESISVTSGQSGVEKLPNRTEYSDSSLNFSSFRVDPSQTVEVKDTEQELSLPSPNLDETCQDLLVPEILSRCESLTDALIEKQGVERKVSLEENDQSRDKLSKCGLNGVRIELNSGLPSCCVPRREDVGSEVSPEFFSSSEEILVSRGPSGTGLALDRPSVEECQPTECLSSVLVNLPVGDNRNFSAVKEKKVSNRRPGKKDLDREVFCKSNGEDAFKSQRGGPKTGVFWHMDSCTSSESESSLTSSNSDSRLDSMSSEDSRDTVRLVGRTISECSADSDDSFIVFDANDQQNEDGYDDTSSVSSFDGSYSDNEDSSQDEDDEVDVVYIPCNRGKCNNPQSVCNSAAANDNQKRESKKKVRFAEGSKLVQTRPLVVWDFAYRRYRLPYWETVARDRARFNDRIAKTAHILAPVLASDHRERVFSRLQNNTCD